MQPSRQAPGCEDGRVIGGRMESIIINEEKCIGCAMCVNDCPNACLYIDGGKAKFRGPICIECGHCFAICPEGAVSMPDYVDGGEPVVPMTEIDSDTLLAAMKSRRSVRQFTAQEVEQEKIDKILEAGRYCPTGANAQDVLFTILGSKQKEAEEICVDMFRSGQKLGAPLVKFLRRIDINDDFFFKGAPLVIVVSAKSSADAGLASSYMELMAESLGLGVLYSGFFVVCSKVSGKLKKLLDLPKGHDVVTCLVIGYPAVKYQRIAPRKLIRSRTL